MNHSREEMAIVNARAAVEAIGRWLSTTSGDRWPYLFHGMSVAADALELCWKVRAGISEDKWVSFPKAAVAVGLAEWFRAPVFNKHPFLEIVHSVRNSRHTSFNDDVPREHVVQTLCLLVDELEIAAHVRLEDHVPREAWRILRESDDVARALEATFRSDSGYLPCLVCGYGLFWT